MLLKDCCHLKSNEIIMFVAENIVEYHHTTCHEIIMPVVWHGQTVKPHQTITVYNDTYWWNIAKPMKIHEIIMSVD